MPNNFGVTLADVGTVVSIPQAQKLPSGIGTGLRGLANNLKTFTDSRDANRRRKREEAKEAKEAARDSAEHETTVALAIANSGVNPFATVAKDITNVAATPAEGDVTTNVGSAVANGANGETIAEALITDTVVSGEIDPSELADIEKETVAAAQKVAVTKTAVSQGSLPSFATEAAVDQTFLELVNRHPGQAHVIAAQMKKLGVDNALFNEIKDDISRREADKDAALDVRSEEYKAGREALGLAANQLSSAEIRAHGSALRQQDLEIEKVKQQLSIEAQKQDIDIKGRKETERQAEKQVEKVFRQQLQTTLAPYLTAYNRLLVQAGDPGSNPVLEKELEELRVLITTKIGTATENLIGKFSPDAATAEALRKESNSYVENTFLNPLAARDSQTSNLIKKFEDKYKLDVTLSLPFINALKGAGLNVGSIDALMLNMPEGIMEKLQDELQGLANVDPTNILSRNSGQLYLTEIMSVLQGDKALSQVDFTPASASQYFKTIKNFSKDLGNQIRGGDLSNGQVYLNAFETVSVAAGELNSANGDTVNMRAAEELLGGGQTKEAFDRLLKDPVFKEEAQLAAIGTRAAAAKVAMNLQTVNKREGFYSLKWDSDAGGYRAIFDQKGWNKHVANQSKGKGGGFLVPGAGSNLVKPKLPPRLQRLGATLNGLTNFLASTGDWDPSTPQATHRELKEFYGRGKIPASLAKQLQQEKNATLDGSDVVKQAQRLKDQLKKEDFKLEIPRLAGEGGVSVDETGAAIVTGVKGQEIRQPTATAIREGYANNQYMNEIEQKAVQMGLDPDIVLSLVYRESGFKPNASSGIAHGLMQVTSKSWDKTAMSRYGKPVKKLTPSENIDLGLYILSKNLEASNGSYKDALAMYHSGKDYATIERTKVHDGNMKTTDYVNIILQGSQG